MVKRSCVKPLALGLLLLCVAKATRTTTAFQSTAFSKSTTRKKINRRQTMISTNSFGRPVVSSHEQYFPSSSALHAAPLTILGSLGVLATVVLIHEAGHYLAARGFGMTVEEFSVGFGPKLIGFQAFGDEFNLRALPLGGYVRFPENYNATQFEQKREERREALNELAKRRREDMELGSKVLDVLTFGALSFKQSVEEAEKAAAAVEAKEEAKPWWQKLRSQKALDKRKDALAPVEIEYYDDPNLLQNRPWQQRAVVLSAGVIFNLLLSFSIYFGEISFGAGLPRPIFEPGIMVSRLVSQDSAAQGLLQKGDVVLDVNCSPLTTSTSPTMVESQKALSNFIATIRATDDGDDLTLSVLRANAKDAGQIETVTLKPKRVNSGPPSIGAFLSPNFQETEILKSDSPLEAARLAADYAGSLTKDTATGLVSFFGEMFGGAMGKTSAPASSQVSGPIGLIKTGSDIVSTRDMTTVLLFAAALSINLGVANALPLPALDGGQLVFVLIEAVTRRKVDQRLQESITGAAVLFLLWLSANAAIGDISNIVGR